MNQTWQTARSTILTSQTCPRKRYLTFHYNGHGIERAQRSLPLAFGAAFHEGVEDLLLDKGVDSSVARAVKYLDVAFANQSVDLDMDARHVAYGIAEQRAIAEALLRAWWAYRGQQFLDQFEVLEVEKEGAVLLSPEVELLYRPDGLVRDKYTGDLYILSWKTTSMFGQFTLNQIGTDMQSMSEVFGVQSENEGMVIEGVYYLLAVKGTRRMDDYLGFKTQDTPLVYGWMRRGPTPEEDEWSHRYKWPNPDWEEGTKEPKTRQLGKGFRKVSIWDNYPGGVEAWVNDLAAQQVMPQHMNALEAIFPEPMPISRRADEIESWRRQVNSSEIKVRNSLLRVQSSSEDERDAVIDEEFPQHTARCLDYNSRCPMWEVCFTPSVGSDPLGSGLYSIHVSNHPEREKDSE